MRLAVEQRDPDVDQRIPGGDPAGGLRPHALFHGRDELPGHRAAHHLVDELDARTARQRLDADLADRELAVPAGLFDMASAAGGRLTEGLPQRHLVRHRVDLHAVAGAQPLQCHIDMRLAQTPQHHLTGVGMVFQPQRRILRHQAGQPLRELVVVGLAVRLDGDGQQRVRHRPGLHQERRVLVGEGVAGLGAGQLGHARQIAGDRLRQRTLLLAEGRRQRADPLVDVMVLVPAVLQAVPGDMHRLVGAQGAGEDPYERDPADVRIGGGLDHLGHQRAVRIAGQLRAGGAVDAGHGRRGTLSGSGEAAGDQLQQLHGAQALPGAVGGRRRGQYGMEGAPGDRRLQIPDERFDVDLLAAQIAVHEGLVLALGDDPLDQAVTRLLDQRQLLLGRRALDPFPRRVVEDPLGQQPDQARHRGVPVGPRRAVQRQIQRQHRIGVLAAEGLLARPDHLAEVGPGRLQVGDDQRPRHTDRRAFVPDHPGRPGHAVRRRNDEKGRVRRTQTGPQFPDEIRIPGGVQHIDLDAAPVDGDQGELYGTLLAVLDLVVIGKTAAVLDAARPVDRAGCQRQGLDQGGLPRAAVADQHHVSQGGGPVGRGCPSGGSRVCTRLLAHVSRLQVDTLR